MNIDEFCSLDNEKQLELTWEAGTIEDNKVENDFQYIVYRLYDFFVEIAYHIQSDKFVHLRVFS